MWARKTYHQIAEELEVISREFRAADARGDRPRMVEYSMQGVELLRALALALRSEQDYGLGTRSEEVAGQTISAVTDSAFVVLTLRGIPSSRNPQDLRLRDALNKIAHANPNLTSFKISPDKHDLVLSGTLGRDTWVAVISILRIVEILKHYPDANVES